LPHTQQKIKKWWVTYPEHYNFFFGAVCWVLVQVGDGGNTKVDRSRSQFSEWEGSLDLPYGLSALLLWFITAQQQEGFGPLQCGEAGRAMAGPIDI
jgi:hypothetical protein